MNIGPTTRRSFWQTSFLSAAILGLASVGSMLIPERACHADSAADYEEFKNLEPAIAELRQVAGHDRRAIVEANMLLTESEAATFWPLYDQYRTDRDKLIDRRIKLIDDFMAKRGAMTQDDAENLTKQYLKLEHDVTDAREKWAKNMRKSLSARTVARFFQIDHKLDAAVELAIAATVPLIH